MGKVRCNVTISAGARERLLQYAEDNHLVGGLSAAIEHVAWEKIKVSKSQIKGQENIDSFLKNK